MNDVSIFGVSITNCSTDKAKKRVGEFLSEQQQRMIVTPNPEILLRARKDAAYVTALNAADLSLPDGFGLRFGSRVSNTVHGADIAEYILTQANEAHMKVVCLVREDGRSPVDAVLAAVQKKAPHVELRAVGMTKDQLDNAAVVKTISEFQADVILVGLGFPEQEMWLLKHLQHILSARIGMAVGGTFDFWTGVAQRAPQSVRTVHMEWLWRLIKEPRRFLRIIRAVVVFPLVSLFSR